MALTAQHLPVRPAHSRLAVASFSLAVLGLLIALHLILLLALGARLSHSYALAAVVAGAACCVAAFVLACAALFDRRKNRLLGLAGWWLSLAGFGFVAASIRFAVRHNLLHP